MHVVVVSPDRQLILGEQVVFATEDGVILEVVGLVLPGVKGGFVGNDEVGLQLNRLFDDRDAGEHGGDDPRDHRVSGANFDSVHRLCKGSLGYLRNKQVHDLANRPGFLEGGSPTGKRIAEEASAEEGSRLKQEGSPSGGG